MTAGRTRSELQCLARRPQEKLTRFPIDPLDSFGRDQEHAAATRWCVEEQQFHSFRVAHAWDLHYWATTAFRLSPLRSTAEHRFGLSRFLPEMEAATERPRAVALASLES